MQCPLLGNSIHLRRCFPRCLPRCFAGSLGRDAVRDVLLRLISCLSGFRTTTRNGGGFGRGGRFRFPELGGLHAERVLVLG